MAIAHIHVYVSGRVQGVGFRFAVAREAYRLNLRGWVRNLPDGRVEATFEGDEEAVREIGDWCREGPPGARVRRVDVFPEAPTGEVGGFQIRA